MKGGTMAAMGSSRARVEGYRTRRPMRAVLLAVILSTTAGLVWYSVLAQQSTDQSCPAPDPAYAAADSSQRLPADALDGVLPAPPQLTRVQVLNANGIRGGATVVDGALARLGLAPTTIPANDPLHPEFDLRCYGEIRFGAAGQAAARTLSLAVPCAEIVRDIRPDAGVDLALGTRFRGVQPNDAAREALLGLAGLGPPVPAGSSRGGLAADLDPSPAVDLDPRPAAEMVARPAAGVVHPELLRLARQVKC